MKTLKELNSKWYWRLVKIIYLIVITILTAFTYFIMRDEVGISNNITTTQTSQVIYDSSTGNEKPYEVTFENGITVSFDRNPSQEDLNEVWGKIKDTAPNRSKKDAFAMYQEYRKQENIQSLWGITKTLLFAITVFIGGTLIVRSILYYIIFGRFFPHE